jgi:hypothetical protein
VDEQDWQNVLRGATYEQEFLLFAIVGRLRMRVWEGSRSGAIQHCEPVEMASLGGSA